MGRDDRVPAGCRPGDAVLSRGQPRGHAMAAVATSLHHAYRPIGDGAPFNDLLMRLDRLGG